VQNLDFSSGGGPSGRGERRAQLLAAAEAMRTWVHARRETWTSLPLGVAPARLPEPFFDVASVAATSPPEPFFDVAAPVPISAPYQPALQPQSVYQVQNYAPPAPVPPTQVPIAHLPPVQQPPMYQPPASPAAVFQPAIYIPLPAGATPGVEAPPQPATREARRMRVPSGVGPFLGELAQRAKRWAITAAIVAAAGGAGWTGWSYWSKLPAASKTGTVMLETVPPDSQVLIEGKVLGDTPLKTELAPGRYMVEFRRRKASRTIEITVTAGTPTLGRLDWTAKRTGSLQVNSDPAGARVLIDGKPRGFTPLSLHDLAVGSHAVVLETAKGSVRRTVAVSEGRTAQISESIFSGWVHVSSPIEVSVSEGGRALRMDDRSLILLSPGSHDLQFQNGPLGYLGIHKVDVKPGETTRMSIVPPPSQRW
jgi:hypothetical protein